MNTATPTVRLSEVLAQNVSAFNHSGTFPDAIELHNEGGAMVDLSGLTLTDDPAAPAKFTLPNGTTLNAVGYLTESLHGAGSPQAQRIQIARGMRLDDKKARARKLAGVAEPAQKM